MFAVQFLLAGTAPFAYDTMAAVRECIPFCLSGRVHLIDTTTLTLGNIWVLLLRRHVVLGGR